LKHKKIISEFWMKNYLNETVAPGGLCGLCANTGKIDTTASAVSAASAVSPRGILSGGIYFCLCPNGRALKEASKKKLS